MLELNNVYCGNCLTVMNNIEDNSIDMILCDLPYGITKNEWDTIIPFDELWKQYNRIIKDNGVIALTGVQPFTSLLVTSNLSMFKYSWVWNKVNATGHLNAHKKPMRQHEDVCVFYKNIPTYNPQGLKEYGKLVIRGGNGNNYYESGTSNYQKYTNYPRSIITFKQDTKKLHPTQKPVALFEYLIKTYTNEGDVVLDNCAGSGTTGVACKHTNRNYILIEQEQKYCDIINERLNME